MCGASSHPPRGAEKAKTAPTARKPVAMWRTKAWKQVPGLAWRATIDCPTEASVRSIALVIAMVAAAISPYSPGEMKRVSTSVPRRAMMRDPTPATRFHPAPRTALVAIDTVWSVNTAQLSCNALRARRVPPDSRPHRTAARRTAEPA